MTSREPFDGTAVVLHLIEAARAWNRPDSRWCGPAERTLLSWVEKLEERYAREQPAPEPVGWEPRRWRELADGDRVEMAGVEAVVVGDAFTNDWHVRKPQSEGEIYRPVPLEHSRTNVRLRWGDPAMERLYDFDPDGEVECLRGPTGQERDATAGYRSVLAGDPVNVLEGWAEDAARTLEAAGLGPIEVMTRTGE